MSERDAFRLLEIAEEIRRIGSDSLATESQVSLPDDVTSQHVRLIIKSRRLRDSFFPPRTFADPAWDIMLDLIAARLEARMVSVSSLCIAASVPPTTALRHIVRLEDEGYITRRPDDADQRRVLCDLTDSAAEVLLNCLADMLTFHRNTGDQLPRC
jgi:DNA-binding transcriptional ArsR family regulator